MTYEQSVTTLATAGFPCLSSSMVIPAAHGASAVVVTCDIGDAQPQLREVRVAYLAVIGWRFDDGSGGAEPVFAFDPCGQPDRRVVEVLLRDDDAAGSLRSRSSGNAATLAVAKLQVLQRARQRWDEARCMATYLDAAARRQSNSVAPIERELLAA